VAVLTAASNAAMVRCTCGSCAVAAISWVWLFSAVVRACSGLASPALPEVPMP